MKVLGLHHAGVLVADPGPISATLDLLGMPREHVESYRGDLEIGFHSCGNALVEVITPRAEGTWNAEWLTRTGPSIQHVAFEVEDIDRALAELRGRGMRMLEPSPRPGAGGTTIAFLDPELTGSILVELVWDPSPAGGGRQSPPSE